MWFESRKSKLKKHGIFDPKRVIEEAQIQRINLSVACALVTGEEAWKQPGIIESFNLFGYLYERESDIRKALVAYYGDKPKVALAALERMRYFKGVLNEP